MVEAGGDVDVSDGATGAMSTSLADVGGGASIVAGDDIITTDGN